MPEGIVFVHVQHARYAYDAADRFLLIQRPVRGQQPVLEIIQVRHAVLCYFAALASLAAVSGHEHPPVGEPVDGQQAVVAALPAALHRDLGLEVFQFACAHDAAPLPFLSPLAGYQRSAVCAHDACYVRPYRLSPGNQFETPQHRRVIERAPLDDDFFADLPGILYPYDLHQGVFDDGIGQARRDVAHGRAFLLGLLDPGIYKDGTPGAQIHRVPGQQSLLCELLDAHVERTCEGFDEGTAARRTGLVEHDVLDDAVPHLHAFHVLSADVQYELHPGQEMLGRLVMGNRLDLAYVDAQSRLHQAFTVTGDDRVRDPGPLGHP